MSITTRRLATVCVAACLSAGLALAPAASAADHGTKATAAQGKKGPTNKKLNSDLTKVRSRTTKAERSIRTLNRTLKALDAIAKGADGKANTLLAAAPQLISGLTQLGDAVTKQIAPGLTALSDAVQKQIAPNLTKLGDAYQSVEYGVAKVSVTNAQIASSSSGTSADIPDDGNAATVQGVTAFVAGAATATINLRADIRSAESDNTAIQGGVGPVGQVGGSLYVKALAGPDVGEFVPCGAPYGGSGGFAGTPTGASIVTPAGPVTNLPLVNIVDGKLRTDTAGPTDTSTSVLPAACTVNTTATVPYEIVWSANFVDVPTSTTPGPKE